MPRYKYMCTECTLIYTVFHNINEVFVDCQECGALQSMQKLLSTPNIIKKQEQEKIKIGDLTKEYIEENRKILEKQKKEARNKEHEPS
jgi:putative FmdB family regulatory protein